MDLATALSDKALLASLSREYELLKATNASVNWEQWITARLKRAAAARVSSSGGGQPHQTQQQQQRQQQHSRTTPPARHASMSLRTPSKGPLPARSSGSSKRSSCAADGDVDGQKKAEWQAQDVTNTTNRQADTQEPQLLRITTAPLQHQTHQAGSQMPPGQLAPMPSWVAAAQLGTALQASKVVPVMHAAADRERRLAAAAALARQQLDMGASPEASAALLSELSGEQQLQPGAQEQLQQMVKLTQEVVQQNQLLQQEMQKQQAQLTQQQGLLATVMHTGGNAADPAAAQPAAVPQPAACSGGSPTTGQQQDQLRQQIKESWLVKGVLQHAQDGGSSQSRQAVAPTATAPDFIRIAGAAAKQPLLNKQLSLSGAQQQQQQVESSQCHAAGDAAGAVERRRQLKAALRQLLTQGAVGKLPDGLAGLVEGLKGLHAAAGGAAEHQQQHQLLAKEGAGQRAAAASLVALLQQQQEQTQEQQQRTQLSKAQQLVLQRRKAQQEEQQRQQQQEDADSQQDTGGRPGWQSDVYVPPPSRMLRVKKGGAADVWNAAAPRSSKVTPGTHHTPGRSNNSKARSKGSSKPQQQLSARRATQPAAAGPRRSSLGSSNGGRQSLSSVLHGGGWRVDGGRRQQREQHNSVPPPGLAARGSESGAWEEQTRLARIEDATAQALQAVARIEQRVQQQQQDQDHKHQLPEEASSAAASQPDVVDGEPSALDSLLAALERVEQQEREIHERWFGNGSGSNRDAGSNDSDGISILATGQCEAAGDAIIQPPQGPSQSAKQMVSQLSQPQPCGDVLSDAAVKAIKGGRQRLLRHQAMLDGTLHELGSGGDVTGSSRSKKNRNSSSRSSTLLRPTQVVEAVADLLLDELLLDEARDLDGFCDALCTQLFEDEFVEP